MDLLKFWLRDFVKKSTSKISPNFHLEKIFSKISSLKFSSVIYIIFSDTIDSVKKVCEEDLKTAKAKINEDSAWWNFSKKFRDWIYFYSVSLSEF